MKQQDSQRNVGGVGATPNVQTTDKFQLDNNSSIGGTPGKRAANGSKVSTTMRQTGKSVGKTAFGASASRGGFGAGNNAQSLKSGSVRDNNDSDFDLEDFADIMEKIQLESAIENKKRNITQLKKKDGCD